MMNFKLSTAVAVVLLASISLPAEARRKRVTPAPKTEVELQIPRTELPLDTYLPQVQEAPPVTLEFGVSTWAPSHFSRDTRTANNQDFQSGSVPFLSLNRIGLLSEKFERVYLKMGLSTAQLEREVQIERSGGEVSADQEMTLISARFGLEYRERRFFRDIVQPYMGLSTLPSVGFAARSALEGNVTTVGAPFEFAAGVTLSPSFMPSASIGALGSSIGIGVHYLLGSIGASRVDGLGLQGSLRVDL